MIGSPTWISPLTMARSPSNRRNLTGRYDTDEDWRSSSHTPGPRPSSSIAPSGTDRAPARSGSFRYTVTVAPSGAVAATRPTHSGPQTFGSADRRRRTTVAGAPGIAWPNRHSLHRGLRNPLSQAPDAGSQAG